VIELRMNRINESTTETIARRRVSSGMRGIAEIPPRIKSIRKEYARS